MKQPSHRSSARGFTLAELAIVLVIVGLLIGGMLVPLSAQIDSRNSRATQKQLSDITEALTGYAASHRATDGNPYLPCPDTDDDGLENRTSDTCVAEEGRFPWSDLGLGREDAWGNRFRYSVAKEYSDRNSGFDLDLDLTPAALRKVCDDSACATVIASNLPAVIVSHGKNGAGAFNGSGEMNPAPAGSDEISNQDADNSFVFHVPSNLEGNEFDDLVVWISPYILFNRMIAAGRLP
jgi:prepilin-type N-terminal cleavage/methylation domain-containing protein